MDACLLMKNEAKRWLINLKFDDYRTARGPNKKLKWPDRRQTQRFQLAKLHETLTGP